MAWLLRRASTRLRHPSSWTECVGETRQDKERERERERKKGGRRGGRGGETCHGVHVSHAARCLETPESALSTTTKRPRHIFDTECTFSSWPTGSAVPDRHARRARPIGLSRERRGDVVERAGAVHGCDDRNARDPRPLRRRIRTTAHRQHEQPTLRLALRVALNGDVSEVVGLQA